MLNYYTHNPNKTKQELVKLYSWLAYDISALGMVVYTWLNIHMLSIDSFIESLEKFLLFLCTLTFLGYRIYILHLDAEKKKIENEDKREDLAVKKMKRG